MTATREPVPSRSREFPWARIAPEKLAWAALVVALLAGGALVYHLTRGTTFWLDEWLWITGRRGNDVGTFLHPYNEHLSLVPITIYRLLFATAGLRTYVPYRLVVIAAHLVCVVLLYVYLRRRVGEYFALLGSLLILFLGPGWQDILWPFQIAWLVAIAAGIGSFLMLDREDRFGSVAACALLTVSVASTSVGVPIALGAAVDVAWSRRSWREMWIVAVPLVLYALWSVAFQHANIVASDVFLVAQFVASSATATLSVVLGLAGQAPATTFGVPLAFAAVALILWLGPRRLWSVRSVSLATVLVAFWILTALGRAFYGAADFNTVQAVPPFPYSSRYLYVDCLFMLLLAAELGRGARWSLRAAIPLGLVTIAAIVSNIGIMRSGAFYLRAAAPEEKADLAALNISRPFIGPDYVATAFPGYPVIVLHAGQLLAAEQSFGSPAYSVPQLAVAPDAARQVADVEMIRAEGLELRAGAGVPVGPTPVVDAASAGATSSTGSCISFRAGPSAPGEVEQLQLTVPGAGVSVLTAGATATVGLRRFGVGYHPLGTLPPGAPATIRFRHDGARERWHLQVATTGRAIVCGLAA
jgi:hypothetical protein